MSLEPDDLLYSKDTQPPRIAAVALEVRMTFFETHGRHPNPNEQRAGLLAVAEARGLDVSDIDRYYKHRPEYD